MGSLEAFTAGRMPMGGMFAFPTAMPTAMPTAGAYQYPPMAVMPSAAASYQFAQTALTSRSPHHETELKLRADTFLPELPKLIESANGNLWNEITEASLRRHIEQAQILAGLHPSEKPASVHYSSARRTICRIAMQIDSANYPRIKEEALALLIMMMNNDKIVKDSAHDVSKIVFEILEAIKPNVAQGSEITIHILNTIAFATAIMLGSRHNKKGTTQAWLEKFKVDCNAINETLAKLANVDQKNWRILLAVGMAQAAIKQMKTEKTLSEEIFGRLGRVAKAIELAYNNKDLGGFIREMALATKGFGDYIAARWVTHLVDIQELHNNGPQTSLKNVESILAIVQEHQTCDWKFLVAAIEELETIAICTTNPAVRNLITERLNAYKSFDGFVKKALVATKAYDHDRNVCNTAYTALNNIRKASPVAVVTAPMSKMAAPMGMGMPMPSGSFTVGVGAFGQSQMFPQSSPQAIPVRTVSATVPAPGHMVSAVSPFMKPAPLSAPAVMMSVPAIVIPSLARPKIPDIDIIDLAIKERESGNIDFAISLLHKELERNPTNIDAMEVLSVCYSRRGKHGDDDLALEFSVKAADAKPDDATAQFNLGLDLFDLAVKKENDKQIFMESKKRLFSAISLAEKDADADSIASNVSMINEAREFITSILKLERV